MKCNLHLLYDQKKDNFTCIHLCEPNRTESFPFNNLEEITKTTFSPIKNISIKNSSDNL